QHLGTRVSHKRVAVFLGLNRVIPVQARLQQLWPAVEAQDDIEVGVGGAGFNQGNRNLGVFTQPGSHDGSGRATTDYQIVVVRLVQILLHSCVLVSVLLWEPAGDRWLGVFVNVFGNGVFFQAGHAEFTTNAGLFETAPFCLRQVWVVVVDPDRAVTQLA